MRMPNPIVQRPTCDDLRTYPTCQKFQYRDLNCPASFWRMNDRGGEGTRGVKISWRGRLVLLFPCCARRARTGPTDILQFRLETLARAASESPPPPPKEKVAPAVLLLPLPPPPAATPRYVQ